MSKNNSLETSRPLELILDVRQEVVKSATRYQAQQHGVIRANPELLQRKWHVQVLAYRREIARYANRKKIKESWREPIDGVAPELLSGEHGASLEDIDQLQFETQTRRTHAFDPDTQQEQEIMQTEMFVFEPPELVAITAKLDECASDLGFDVSIDSEPDIFGVDPDYERDKEATNGRSAN